ncbi:MAG: cation diffusion facilitator family transporter [Verrucomicrobiae bacterium]|nr:cation diffusion facilitator family transporter [Verrucomicrobiae bacterium]
MKERPLTQYALLSVAVAIVILLLKLVAWHLTGSIGLLSDALESVVNLVAAFIAWISLSVAIQPEDKEHAFGHSKAEYFASGLEGLFIFIAALGIAWAAIERFFHPQALTHTFQGILVSSGASVINLVVALILLRVGKKRSSVALEADGKHLMTDVWTSVGVIIGISLVALTQWWWLDPMVGLLLSAHIVVTGLKLMKESMRGLMDFRLPKKELALIQATLDKYAAEGIGYHALRTRRAAALKFVAVHLLMPGEWTVVQGHTIVERIEEDLRNAIPNLIVFTHMEPLEDPASWEDVKLERGKVFHEK